MRSVAEERREDKKLVPNRMFSSLEELKESRCSTSHKVIASGTFSQITKKEFMTAHYIRCNTLAARCSDTTRKAHGQPPVPQALISVGKVLKRNGEKFENRMKQSVPLKESSSIYGR